MVLFLMIISFGSILLSGWFSEKVHEPFIFKPMTTEVFLFLKQKQTLLYTVLNNLFFGFQMVERIADCMTFGALRRCEKCKNGQLTYASGIGYKCNGDATEWVKCDNIVLEPPRKAFKGPPDMLDHYPFL